MLDYIQLLNYMLEQWVIIVGFCTSIKHYSHLPVASLLAVAPVEVHHELGVAGYGPEIFQHLVLVGQVALVRLESLAEPEKSLVHHLRVETAGKRGTVIHSPVLTLD